jgi:hypothetical protein
MTRVSEVIRGWLGWCPQSSVRQSRTCPDPGAPCQAPARSSPAPAAPSPATTTQTESHPAYQENILLILLLVAGLFSLIDLKWLALAGIFSAVVVYYDAGTLHAGEKFGKESFFGDVVTWRPLTWAICVLIFSIFFLAVYTFSRKEIFDANN